MNLLNRGFHFAVQPNKQEIIKNTLIDFEMAIGTDVDGDNNAKMRIDAVNVIKNIEIRPATKEMCKYRKTAEKLRNKKESVYFTITPYQ